MEPIVKGEIGISYEDRNGYLYVFFSGKREGLEDARQYWLTAIEECNRRGYRRLLVEQYFPVPLSRMDTFSLAEALAQMHVRNLKIAFVDRDITQNGMNLFAETVAVNRGGVGKVFTNIADAEKYLLATWQLG
jgi:hypothetical protein